MKLFFFFVFVLLFIKGIILIYPDLNLTYPFLSPDSYDWIANGLYYAGYLTRATFRPPGLPLLIAALYKLGILNFLPLLNQLVLFGVLITSFKILKNHFGAWPSFLTILLVVFNYFLQDLSDYILADFYAIFFILAGYYFYAKAEEDERAYIAASLFWSISFLFQYAITFMVPAIVLHFLIFRKKINIRILFSALLISAAVIGAWMIYKKIELGSFLYSGVQHVELLKPHFDSLFFYSLNLFSVLSILVLLLIFAGVARFVFIGRYRRSSFLWLNVFISVCWIIFWVFLYNWNDRRFILYLMFFLLPFAAITIQLISDYYAGGKIYAKAVIIALLFLTLYGSKIPYSNALCLDTLKFTNSLAIKFKTTQESNFRSNIVMDSLMLVRDHDGFNPVNLIKLYYLRENINFQELEVLREIKNYLTVNHINQLYVKYDDDPGSRWIVDKMRYSNYFKIEMTLNQNTNCLRPCLEIKSPGPHEKVLFYDTATIPISAI